MWRDQISKRLDVGKQSYAGLRKSLSDRLQGRQRNQGIAKMPQAVHQYPARISSVQIVTQMIYWALARPSGRAPRWLIEPSLTVGLVPRIATRPLPTQLRFHRNREEKRSGLQKRALR